MTTEDQDSDAKAGSGISGTNLLAECATHLQTPDCLHDTEAAAARFDVTPYRLWLLFQTVDENHDGIISKKELVHALSSASNANKQSEHITSLDPPAKKQCHEEHQEFMYETDEEDEQEDDVDTKERLPLEDIRALDELWDRVLARRDNSPSSSDQDPDEEKTEAHRNYPDTSAERRGITFPQFCRIMRHMWLQQLLSSELDNPDDPDSHYRFECVDYASGNWKGLKMQLCITLNVECSKADCTSL